MAQLTAEKDKLNDLLKIAQADKEEAESLVAEAKATSEAAMEEGGKAKEQMEIMAKQREQERALAMRAVGELKTMRGAMTEKDTLLMKAATRQKEMQASVEAATKEKAEAENEKSKLQDELEQTQTKLKTMEMKMSAIAGGASPKPAGDAGEDGAAASADAAAGSPLDAMLASIDAQAKELEAAQQALSAEKEASREKAAKLASAEARATEIDAEKEELQRQIDKAREEKKEIEDLHITTITGLELNCKNLEEEKNDLGEKLEQADLLKQKLEGDVKALQQTAQRQSVSGSSAGGGGNMTRPGVRGGARCAHSPTTVVVPHLVSLRHCLFVSALRRIAVSCSGASANAANLSCLGDAYLLRILQLAAPLVVVVLRQVAKQVVAETAGLPLWVLALQLARCPSQT
jgi:hypothetical protein